MDRKIFTFVFLLFAACAASVSAQVKTVAENWKWVEYKDLNISFSIPPGAEEKRDENYKTDIYSRNGFYDGQVLYTVFTEDEAYRDQFETSEGFYKDTLADLKNSIGGENAVVKKISSNGREGFEYEYRYFDRLFDPDTGRYAYHDMPSCYKTRAFLVNDHIYTVTAGYRETAGNAKDTSVKQRIDRFLDSLEIAQSVNKENFGVLYKGEYRNKALGFAITFFTGQFGDDWMWTDKQNTKNHFFASKRYQIKIPSTTDADGGLTLLTATREGGDTFKIILKAYHSDQNVTSDSLKALAEKDEQAQLAAGAPKTEVSVDLAYKLEDEQPSWSYRLREKGGYGDKRLFSGEYFYRLSDHSYLKVRCEVIYDSEAVYSMVERPLEFLKIDKARSAGPAK